METNKEITNDTNK